MKKAALTIFVLACFAIYSFHQRNDGSSSVHIAAPAPASSSSGSSSGSGNSTGSGSGGSNPRASGPTASGQTYKDGQYTGTAADAYYGYVQVQAIVNGGKLTDVKFLQYPNDRPTSVEINSQATPYLKQEALQAQSANVNIISGATDTSQAFIQSLSSALSQAHS